MHTVLLRTIIEVDLVLVNSSTKKSFKIMGKIKIIFTNSILKAY